MSLLVQTRNANVAKAYDLDGKADGKMYVVNLLQSGTSDPTGVVIINQLGGTPTLSRDSVGSYKITLAGAFKDAKTGCTITPCRDDSSVISGIYRIDDNTIGVFTGGVDGSPSDDILQGQTAWVVVAP